ncbi:hypothetical protein [Deinococcus sp. RIT780]|uniref:hypothetical protein n=1 Tax=Deinococcus sp. RIT780 TaxID=2870472 RepID=UPI001C897C50|nr:hypothetical protein [Deinococcus sp. RIT780]MBX8464394.1 hypothetical protein [Deinococcus sp. RIT780]
MILLADANILFDFGWVDQGLQHLAALGPLEVLENVRAEIREPDILQVLQDLEVTFVPLEDAWEADLREAKRGGLSLPDATCLVYARRSGRTVLTSERRLRERCQAENVEVHGSLWVVDQLYRQGRCESATLCRWLTTWEGQGARLPTGALAELRRTLRC